MFSYFSTNKTHTTSFTFENKKIDYLLLIFGVCDTLKNTTLRHCHWTRNYGWSFFKILKWTVEDAPFALKIKKQLLQMMFNSALNPIAN